MLVLTVLRSLWLFVDVFSMMNIVSDEWPSTLSLLYAPDFHRCNKALSARDQDVAPCEWYQRVYKSLCPMSWVGYKITLLIVLQYDRLDNGPQNKISNSLVRHFSMQTRLLLYLRWAKIISLFSWFLIFRFVSLWFILLHEVFLHFVPRLTFDQVSWSLRHILGVWCYLRHTLSCM